MLTVLPNEGDGVKCHVVWGAHLDHKAAKKLTSRLAFQSTAATMATPNKDPTPVFFYVPNLIGYARVVLSAYSLYIALDDYKTSVLCYTLSFVCDYFDGFFARWFDQCTCITHVTIT